MIRNILFLFMGVICFSFLPAHAQYKADWASIDSRPIPAWFEEAKFGIFIHWGVYSVPSWAPVDKKLDVGARYSEWYWHRLIKDKSKVGDAFRNYHRQMYGDKMTYADFAAGFKAELYNPDQWADLFAASGAKYVVLTSKHHEGFTLWPSLHSWNWNSVDIGPHRDLAGDLTRSVKAKGLRMGFYYSLYEWYNPLYLSNVNQYVTEHMIPQMKDLVTRYKPDVLWTDGEWEHPSETWKSTEFLAWLYNESLVKKDVVVNDRWGKETRSKHGGFYTTEYDLIHTDASKYAKITHPWEECRGIGSSFGFNRNEDLSSYSTSEQLVHTLVEKVARGGNLLLDIGPAADGTIPVIMQQRLMDMGGWLKVNGDAIYGTASWDDAPVYTSGNEVYYTRKGKDLYMICTKFPQGSIVVQKTGKPSSVKMLGVNQALKTSFANGKLTVTPPAVTPATNPCEYAWVFKLEGAL